MQEKFIKYARLLLEGCLCIKEGQPLIINAPVESYEFIRILTEEACKRGIRDIYLDWYDDVIKHSELKYFGENDICKSKFWDKSIYNEYSEQGGAVLFLISNSNVDMTDIMSDKLMMAGKLSLTSRAKYREMQENNQVSWCIASVATKEWANLIFDNKNNEIDKLWNKIFEICLVDKNDPVKEWANKMKDNQIICEKLDNLKIKEMHYTNSLGTDLRVSLDERAKWCGGSSVINGQELVVNLPTEEVFTTPNKFMTSGIVYTSMPLVHQGVVIKDICLEFKEGKVINYSASVGEEELKNILNMDEEAMMLGEVALVDKNTPICQSGLLFYETLFDENASCHIALGRGFKECLENGHEIADEELEKIGYNKSKNHVDIMIGTDDMQIKAITYEGQELLIFKNGSFVI